jgi:hypothetical protein
LQHPAASSPDPDYSVFTGRRKFRYSVDSPLNSSNGWQNIVTGEHRNI